MAGEVDVEDADADVLPDVEEVGGGGDAAVGDLGDVE